MYNTNSEHTRGTAVDERLGGGPTTRSSNKLDGLGGKRVKQLREEERMKDRFGGKERGRIERERDKMKKVTEIFIWGKGEVRR